MKRILVGITALALIVGISFASTTTTKTAEQVPPPSSPSTTIY